MLIMMRFILLFLVLGLTTGFSQTTNNPSCKALLETQKYEEAFRCYQADENNPYSVFMTAWIGKQLGFDKEAGQAEKKLKSKKFRTGTTMYYYALLYPDSTLEHHIRLRKGLAAFPEDTLLLTGMANYHMKQENYAASIDYLKELEILKEDKLTIYQRLGGVYQHLNMIDHAIEYYDKTLQVDDDNFEAMYGLGSIYYNRGAEYISMANYSNDLQKIDELTWKGKEQFKLAVPYLEKCLVVEPENQVLIRSLIQCYTHLEMDEKKNQMMKKLN